MLAALSLPFLVFKAQTLPGNNDIETWLPEDSLVRANYERFKEDFGVEELIIVGLATDVADEQLVESVSRRLARLPRPSFA